MVCVIDNDSEAFDLSPGQLTRARDEVVRKLRRDVAEASHHRLACQAKRPFGLLAILAKGNQLGGRVDGFGQVLQEIIEVPASGGHRSIASSRMR